MVRTNLGGMFSYFGDLALSNVLSSKFSIAMTLLSFYMGAQYHVVVDRIEDYFLHHNVPMEEKYFSDPYRLNVLIETNSAGKREVYLHHGPSDKKIGILDDTFAKKYFAGSLTETLDMKLDMMSLEN